MEWTAFLLPAVHAQQISPRTPQRFPSKGRLTKAIEKKSQQSNGQNKKISSSLLF
jgi:hypothetical protein